MVEAADVVIEVLDARDPLSSRCPDVERFVRQAGATKKLVLLLNKIGQSHELPPSAGPPRVIINRPQHCYTYTTTSVFCSSPLQSFSRV